LNKTFLHDNQWDLVPEDFTIFRMSCSPFSCFFSEANRKKWAPFVDITEEEQHKLLNQLYGSSDEELEDELGEWVIVEKEQKATSDEIKISFRAEVQFQRVDKKIRKLMLRNTCDEFLVLLDQEIVKFMQVPAGKLLTKTFDEPFHRLICHGVCQFYSLVSKSEDFEGGRRVVIIKSKNSLHFPSTTLSKFLESL